MELKVEFGADAKTIIGLFMLILNGIERDTLIQTQWQGSGVNP